MNDTMSPPATITINVNDQAYELPAGVTLAALVDRLQLTGRQGVAVAVGAEVVPRRDWPARVLAPGDRVLVIRASQGG